jgi:hypothetical protein
MEDENELCEAEDMIIVLQTELDNALTVIKDLTHDNDPIGFTQDWMNAKAEARSDGIRAGRESMREESARVAIDCSTSFMAPYAANRIIPKSVRLNITTCLRIADTIRGLAGSV